MIAFHNGSWIRVVASNDNARGHRANLLLVDEFVKVDEDLIDTVFKKMLTSQREPAFLHKAKYKITLVKKILKCIYHLHG